MRKRNGAIQIMYSEIIAACLPNVFETVLEFTIQNFEKKTVNESY